MNKLNILERVLDRIDYPPTDIEDVSLHRYAVIKYSATGGVAWPIGLYQNDLTTCVEKISDFYDSLKASAIRNSDSIPCLMIIDAIALSDIKRDGAFRHRHRILYQAGIY